MPSQRKQVGRGRPFNDPGPLGWDSDRANSVRLDAGVTVRKVRDRLEDDFGVVLSERAVDCYFLPAGHANGRAPRASVCSAIASILGVKRAELGTHEG